MSLKTLQTFLDDHDIEYVVISHSKAYTAQRIAASAHVSGKEIAKTIILKADSELLMAVLPGTEKVSLTKVKNIMNAAEIDLAQEAEFAKRFSDCEVGAMPPFGSLYDMKTLVDKKLTHDEQIYFNACSHRELIKMPYDAYANLEQPEVVDISIRE
jgi:Ala-tRNA(Pro) deacylase